MKFRTSVKIQKPDFQIAHDSIITMIGSCFTENIGRLLSETKFNVKNNPTGILYNPVSILNSIQLITGDKKLDNLKFITRDERFYHYSFHSDFSGKTETEIISLLEQILNDTFQLFKKSDFLFITLGSAHIFHHQELDCIVANCHKMPQQLFNNRILSYNEIIASLIKIFEIINSVNPALKFIFTVSPVIHIRNGLIENNRSKSLLCAAIHEICERTGSYYFPSYDITISELRDYRFYSEDMIHISDFTINYIWERFSETFFSEKTRAHINQIEKINRNIEHRPFNSSSNEYKKHLEQTLIMINALSKKANIDLTTEKNVISQRLSSFVI
jgi:hypothetical protein